MKHEIQILDGSDGPELPIVEGGGLARAVVWPGTGARSRSLHHIWLEPEAQTIELNHPSDAVYYVIEGAGAVIDQSAGESHELDLGAMFHVDGGTSYLVCAGDSGMELVGGPAPADDSLYLHISNPKD